MGISLLTLTKQEYFTDLDYKGIFLLTYRHIRTFVLTKTAWVTVYLLLNINYIEMHLLTDIMGISLLTLNLCSSPC